jgi:hypothetical protein
VKILGDLIRALRQACVGLFDRRTGKNVHYSMIDIGMAAFAVFFMQSPSFRTAAAYNLEHNFGHSKENLAAVLATLNLLAFTFRTVAELTEELWHKALEN